MEELAAATGLAESTVRAVLTFKPELPRLPDFYDRGAEGWFYDPPGDLRRLTMNQVCRPGARRPGKST